MAKYGSSLAEVKVYINGKEQAEKDLEDLKAKAKVFQDQMTLANNAMLEAADKMAEARERANEALKDPTKGKDSAEYKQAVDEELKAQEMHDKAQKRFDENKKEYSKYQRLIKESEKLTVDLETAMKSLADQDIKSLRTLQRQLEAIRNQIDPKKDTDGQFLDFVNKSIKEVSDTIKNRKGDLIEFADIVDNLNSVDDRSLDAVIKRLKELIATTDKLEVEKLKQYNNELAQAEGEQQRRIGTRAEGIISDVKKGEWKGTIAETEEAIKNIKEYQRVMKDTSPEKIKEVEETFKSLNESLAKAKSELLSYEEALEQTAQLSNGTWDGTLEDLEKLKRSLEYFKKNKLKIGADAKELETLEKGLKDTEAKMKGTLLTTKEFETVLKHLDKASPAQLQLAAKELQERFNKARQGTVEYVQTAAKLREVNKRILEVNRSLREQENVIIRTAKRLASYILVYAGWNEVWGQIKRLTQANLELSDSLADIQKTTGLTETAVGRLSDQINAIDTRTAQKELHDLAYEAGKLGISAEEDVLAFVKAGNQLLVALGEDLGGAEAVRQLMKVNAILGETEELGIEKALLATGSAINEISQTSRASAGPIADMVSRMGAIGSAAGLSMADLIALAGTADSLGQSAEVAATAFNKFIATLTSNPVDVAFALGMDPDQLQKQLDAGNTMDVIREIFTKMSTMGNMADLAPIMGELGSEGARMTQVLVTMAKGIGELNAQVYTSKKAFEEATSVTNEYNIKNESAAAIVQRMGNNLRESFVQSGFVEWLRDVLQWLYYLPQRIEENKMALLAWKTVVWELVMVTGAKFVKFLTVELVGAFKSLINVIRLAAIEQATLKWGAYTEKMWEAATMTTKLKYAVQALFQVITKNPFVAVAAAIGFAIAAIQTFAKETSIAIKTTAELETELQNEQAELSRLRRSIDNANSANGERASLIKQLNERYGKYLGFLVTETNYVDQQAYIYDLLNAKLRETVSLKMQEKMMDDIAQKHAADRLDANKDIQSALNVAVGSFDAPEVMDKIYAEITNQVENNQKDVNAVLKAGIGELASDLQKQREEIGKKYADGIIGYDVYTKELEAVKERQKSLYDLRDGIKSLLNVETDINKEISEAQGIIDRQQRTSEKRSMDIVRNNLDEQFKNLKTDATLEQLQTLQSQTNNYIKQQAASVADLKAKKESLQSLSYAEQREYEELTKEIYGTTEAVEELNLAEASSSKPDDERLARWQQLHAQKQKTVELSKEEEDKLAAANAEIERMNKLLKPVNQKLIDMNGINIWGSADAENLAKNSPTQLVAMWDKLEKDASRLSEQSFKTIGEFQEKNGKLMATQFWKNFDTRDEAVKWYNEQKNAIAARLKELGYNTSGHFLTSTGSGGDSEAEKEARKDMNAALAALEEHFLKRKVIIQQAYLDEKISGEEMNRQIADNDEEFRLARIELRKLLAGDANTFNQSLYPELNGKDLQETSRVLQIIGDAVIDGLRKNVQKDETEIREGAIKIRQSFENELLKNDMFGKFENNFRESLDKLELLSSEFERDIAKTISFDVLGEKISGASIMGLDEESQKKRLTALMELSEKSYQINEQGMVNELMKNKEFANWIENLDADKKTVLLQQLRDYYDQRLAVTKQYQDKLAKEFESYYKQSGKQAEYEQGKQKVESSNADIKQMEGIGITRGIDYDGKRQTISDEFDNENKRLIDQMEFYKQRLATMKKGSEEFLAIQQLITDSELERNQLLAQSQRDLTQVYMDEWTKRAERWGQWGEMFGEYLGEQVMLEKQANDARARGDLETAKKIEQQQKQNKQALIQNLLSKIVDEAALWAKEYALKMMFNSLMLAEEKKKAVEEVTLQGKQSMLSIFLSALTGQAAEAKIGLPGLITGAIVFAATMALQAMAKSAISNMFPEAETGSTGTRKLSTGMLTYAEGNYPVLGNDGKVYDAKYEGAGMKTGVYGGGAHFGIFSEKQPEMIVDGKTTQKLILNYPYIYDAITTIAKNGRLVNAMPTFATGDYPAGMKQIAPIAEVDASTGSNEEIIQIRATMEESKEVNRQLLKLLQGGITAHLDGLETHKQQKKNERFLKRRGID